MTLIDKVRIIERVHKLIQRKATGNPKQLSTRLGMSERYVFDLINLMKKLGAPIYFCKNRNSYCYTEDGVFSFGFTPNSKIN